MKQYTSRVRSMFFFFNDTATTEIYTLSLHDALPICVYAQDMYIGAHPQHRRSLRVYTETAWASIFARNLFRRPDRKSTRLNSSHANISYAVFCLKKKKKQKVPVELSPRDEYYCSYTG